jgi:hypothetical protein
MTVFDHPRWPTLLGYLFIRRGRDGVNGARHRLEVRQVNLSCPLAVDPKCARMPETTAACQRVRDAIAGRPTTPGLFEKG